MTNKWAPEEGQLERVTAKIVERHAEDEIFTGACSKNGCWDVCLLKGHVGKDGKVNAIETDNSIHPNCGREDEYCDFDDFVKGMYQKRACTRGRLLRSDVESPTRITQPMRRVGPKGPGATFEPISWDEALDEIARMYSETREKYGPLSVYCDGMMGKSWDPWGSYLPGGAVACWGEDSYESTNFADDIMYGHSADWIDQVDGIAEMQTFFDSKLIILFGLDTANNFTERTYYQMLAKEKGIPIIYIDPRFSWTAQSIATQWIPIKPGTDIALIFAMTYVLIEEDLVDHEFIEKFVEPEGYRKYVDMIMGNEPEWYCQGMASMEEPKTPEWAEQICGIPAETIRELARLYGKTSQEGPVYIRMIWAATRAIYGKDTARAFNVLQTICGNFGKKGCAGNGTGFGRRKGTHAPYSLMHVANGTGPYGETICMEAEAYNKAVLLHPKMEAGEITKEEYCYEIGCSATGPMPNIHMICDIPSNRNLAAGWYGVNERLESLKQVDYFVYMHWNLKNATCCYADIVLPQTSSSMESPWNSLIYNVSFCNGINPGTHNHFILGDGKSKAPENTRYTWWIVKEIAVRLGIADEFCPNIKDMDNDELEEFIIKDASRIAYEAWCGYSPNAKNAPTWEEFMAQEERIFRWPMEDYFVYGMRQIQEGVPFNTKSGKIEYYNEFIADHDMRKAKIGASQRQLGCNDIKALPFYRKSPQGMQSPRTKQFPLYMITPHSPYRQHTAFDHSDWVRDEHRASIWLSVADAKARGIKDGDPVRVFSDCGEVQVTAYVTSRVTPGVTVLPFGRWYEPNGVKTDLMPDGIDTRGDCNFLISDDHYGDVKGSILCNALVQVEKLSPATLIANVSQFIQGEE